MTTATASRSYQFLFVGVWDQNCSPMRDVFSIWAPTAAEALATCQRRYPGFTIRRWDLADHMI